MFLNKKNKKKREGKEKKSDSACQVIAVALAEKEKMTVGMREIMARVKLCHISTVHNNMFYECQNNTAAVFSLNI